MRWVSMHKRSLKNALFCRPIADVRTKYTFNQECFLAKAKCTSKGRGPGSPECPSILLSSCYLLSCVALRAYCNGVCCPLPDFKPKRTRYECINYGIIKYWSTQLEIAHRDSQNLQLWVNQVKFDWNVSVAIRTLCLDSVRLVNFYIFKWLYLAYYWVYLHQTSSGDFVKLGLHFMTMWINSC